ncbi:MAG TPA: hypothetical protein VHZ03_35420 [Trebonia sp.]|jgi:hypothetical protein|nr:hypothetical protein [Trebonia sp.]
MVTLFGTAAADIKDADPPWPATAPDGHRARQSLITFRWQLSALRHCNVTFIYMINSAADPSTPPGVATRGSLSGHNAALA